ncbi:MAG: hypothetical protein WCG26_14705, partial [Chloroflexales bacterium]
MKKQRILHVIDHTGAGGAQAVLHDLIRTLKDRYTFGVAVLGRGRKIRWANHYVYTLVGMK